MRSTSLEWQQTGRLLQGVGSFADRKDTLGRTQVYWRDSLVFLYWSER
jgi:hypothetical protein